MTRRPNPARCEHLCRRFGAWEPYRLPDVLTRRCLDCHATLPLGPSNDAPPEVQQEIRAAEIAAGYVRDDFWLLNDECRGWSCAESSMADHTDAWHAGYLARAIVEHGDS